MLQLLGCYLFNRLIDHSTETDLPSDTLLQFYENYTIIQKQSFRMKVLIHQKSRCFITSMGKLDTRGQAQLPDQSGTVTGRDILKYIKATRVMHQGGYLVWRTRGYLDTIFAHPLSKKYHHLRRQTSCRSPSSPVTPSSTLAEALGVDDGRPAA